MYTYWKLKEEYDIAQMKFNATRDEILDKINGIFIYNDKPYCVDGYDFEQNLVSLYCNLEESDADDNHILLNIEDLDELIKE